MCDKLHKLEDALEDQMLQKSFDLIYEYWDELGELDKLGELCGLDELECPQILTIEEKIICKERSQGTFCFMIKTAKEDTKDPIQHSEVNIKAE